MKRGEVENKGENRIDFSTKVIAQSEVTYIFIDSRKPGFVNYMAERLA